MNQKRTVEIFSAGCPACKEVVELVTKVASPEHEVHVRDMHRREVAARAKEQGVRSVPAVLIDGKPAGCCAGPGPNEEAIREALR